MPALRPALILFAAALALPAAVGAAEKPIDISLVCFKAEPGDEKDPIKVDPQLEKLLEPAISKLFRGTKYRVFTFVAQDRLAVTDGGKGQASVGGLSVSVEAARQGETVAMTVEIKQGDKSAGDPKKWDARPGEWCIQAGPPVGSGRLFVALMVDKAERE